MASAKGVPSMLDLLYIATGAGFLILCGLYALACAHL